MSARTRQGSNAIKKKDKLCLINKKMHNEIRKQQEEAENKKDEEQARKIQEKAEREEEVMNPHNLHNVLNGVKSTQMETMVVDDKWEEHSPLKKCSGSSKSATKTVCIPQFTPSEAMTTA
jgi:hypothetical protein